MGYIFFLPNMNKKYVIGRVAEWIGCMVTPWSGVQVSGSTKELFFLGQGADFWRPTYLWSLKVYFWLI